MDIAGFLPKRAVSAAVVALCAGGLSGCFDLEQKVAIKSDGSGSYAVVLKADGIVGEGLDKKHADIDIGGDNDLVTRVVRKDGTTIQTSQIAFRTLSDLRLGDETLSLHPKGKTLLGLGPSEVNFHRSFNIDHGRRYRDDDDDDEHWGRSILHSMFGDHTYTFSVWLPGTIEHIAPVQVANRVVHPTVWSDKYGHTIIWTMPLSDMFLADRIDFDVDFSARGDFRDERSSPGAHRHRFRHRHRHDDDDDDDDAS
jgi:hypothetical protein